MAKHFSQKITVSNRLFRTLQDRLKTSFIVAIAPYNSSIAPLEIPAYVTEANFMIEELDRTGAEEVGVALKEKAKFALKDAVNSIEAGRALEYVRFSLATGIQKNEVAKKLLEQGMEYGQITELINGTESGNVPDDFNIVRVGIKAAVERSFSMLASEFAISDKDMGQLQNALKQGNLTSRLGEFAFFKKMREERKNVADELREKCLSLGAQYEHIKEIEDLHFKLKKIPQGSVAILEAKNKKTLYVLPSASIPSISIKEFRKPIADLALQSEISVLDHYRLVASSLEADINSQIEYTVSISNLKREAGERIPEKMSEALPPLEELVEIFADPDSRSFLFNDKDVRTYFCEGWYELDGTLSKEGIIAGEMHQIREGENLMRVGKAKKKIASTEAKNVTVLVAELKEDGFDENFILELSTPIHTVFNGASVASAAVRTALDIEAEKDIATGRSRIDDANQDIALKINRKVMMTALEECPALVKLLGGEGMEYSKAIADARNSDAFSKSAVQVYVNSIANGVQEVERSEKDDDLLFVAYMKAYKSLRYAVHPEIGHPMLWSLEKKIRSLTRGFDPAMAMYKEESRFYDQDNEIFNSFTPRMDTATAKFVISLASKVHQNAEQMAMDKLKPELEENRNGNGNIVQLVSGIKKPATRLTAYRKLAWIAQKAIDGSLAEREYSEERSAVEEVLGNARDKAGFLARLAGVADEFLRGKREDTLSTQSYKASKNSLLSDSRYLPETNAFLMNLSDISRSV